MLENINIFDEDDELSESLFASRQGRNKTTKLAGYTKHHSGKKWNQSQVKENHTVAKETSILLHLFESVKLANVFQTVWKQKKHLGKHSAEEMDCHWTDLLRGPFRQESTISGDNTSESEGTRIVGSRRRLSCGGCGRTQ